MLTSSTITRPAPRCRCCAPARPTEADAPSVTSPATTPSERGDRHHRTSRWATWDSSWASTPSSSSAVERRRMPVVTQTTECFGRATGRERVGHVGVGDGDPRLGHVGDRAQPVDHAVQLGRLLRRDLAGAHGAHRERVGEEPLEERDADAADADQRGTDRGSSRRRSGRRRARRTGHRAGTGPWSCGRSGPGRGGSGNGHDRSTRGGRPGVSAGDQAVVAEQVAHLGDGGVGGRQHQVGGVERVVGERAAQLRARCRAGAASAAAKASSSPASTAASSPRRGR